MLILALVDLPIVAAAVVSCGPMQLSCGLIDRMLRGDLGINPVDQLNVCVK
jgi:hypothetical protein